VSELVKGGLGVEQDHHKHVVQVVSDPSGETPDRVQPLSLGELGFQTHPLGDVPAHPQHSNEIAAGVPHCCLNGLSDLFVSTMRHKVGVGDLQPLVWTKFDCGEVVLVKLGGDSRVEQVQIGLADDV